MVAEVAALDTRGVVRGLTDPDTRLFETWCLNPTIVRRARSEHPEERMRRSAARSWQQSVRCHRSTWLMSAPWPRSTCHHAGPCSDPSTFLSTASPASVWVQVPPPHCVLVSWSIARLGSPPQPMVYRGAMLPLLAAPQKACDRESSHSYRGCGAASLRPPSAADALTVYTFVLAGPAGSPRVPAPSRAAPGHIARATLGSVGCCDRTCARR